MTRLVTRVIHHFADRDGLISLVLGIHYFAFHPSKPQRKRIIIHTDQKREKG